MRIAFDVNAKAVTAVVAVAALSVGSFFAGERHQLHKSVSPVVSETAVVPAGVTVESWCAGHHSTNWTTGDKTPINNLEAVFALTTTDSTAHETGTCDAGGRVWELVPNPSEAPVPDVFDQAAKEMGKPTGPSSSVVWADEKDPNTSTMPVYGIGQYNVEAAQGVKLHVEHKTFSNGDWIYITALADKKAILGKE